MLIIALIPAYMYNISISPCILKLMLLCVCVHLNMNITIYRIVVVQACEGTTLPIEPS